ncbi:MAG: glycosyltransferase family 2 protein [Magnetovibrionaceae bacterium]
MNIHPCAVVPSHNHSEVIAEMIRALRDQGLPVLVIDDGSDEPSRSVIAALHAPEDGVQVHRQEPNQGKGAAVSTGLRLAREQGYTHAIQVDADGQHDTDALPALIGKMREHPNALISGQPVYDQSIPASRRIARYLTHVWVWVETLSFRISDSMCGFRAYPVDATVAVLDREAVGLWMDFDIEIMVRLFWRGTPVLMTPVRVVYREGNTSNFDLFADNWRITKMHTRLVFTMLFRLPGILKNRPPAVDQPRKWADMNERGMAWGLKFLATTYKLLGYKACWAIMQPVLFYFFVTGTAQRDASRRFWLKIYQLDGRQSPPNWHQLWRHTRSFGRMALDKFAAWMGDIPLEALDIPDEAEIDRVIREKRGLLVLTSHLGNIEVCRALSHLKEPVPLTVFAHTKNAAKFNQLLASYNPNAIIDVVEVEDLGPATAVDLQARLEKGEWIAIAADRTPVQGQKRLTRVPFLGQEAAFSQGPIILASILKCPVYSMICLKEENGFRVYFDRLFDRVELDRRDRETSVKQYLSRYTALLEAHCRERPDQWFNFFDFWDEKS